MEIYFTNLWTINPVVILSSCESEEAVLVDCKTVYIEVHIQVHNDNEFRETTGDIRECMITKQVVGDKIRKAAWNSPKLRVSWLTRTCWRTEGDKGLGDALSSTLKKYRLQSFLRISRSIRPRTEFQWILLSWLPQAELRLVTSHRKPLPSRKMAAPFTGTDIPKASPISNTTRVRSAMLLNAVQVLGRSR
jgi:hypothetical protein